MKIIAEVYGGVGWFVLTLFVLQCMIALPVSGGAAEDLFMRGYEKFEAGDYEDALSDFERVLERFPESNRARDSRYFLDRLRLYSVRGRTRQLLVRVLLTEGRQVEGQLQRPYVLLDGQEDKVTDLGSGQDFSASLEGEDIVFSSEGQQFELSEASLEPLSLESGYFNLNGIDYRGRLELQKSGAKLQAVNVLSLNKYLYGVIKKELAPDWPMEVMKSQAVASRSFALNMMTGEEIEGEKLRADVSTQVYEGKTAETDRGRQAVEATRGEVLVYAGEIVPAFFHANSGGYLEDGRHIWGGEGFTFIEPGPDNWSRETQHSRWEKELAIDELSAQLEAAGHAPMASDPGLRAVGILPSGRASEVSYLTATGERTTLNANDFRMAVGGDRIKSSWFEEIRRSGREIFFKGRGWGHGVGMSQWGAKEMAKSGKNYREILEFYFRHAEFSNNLNEYLSESR